MILDLEMVEAPGVEPGFPIEIIETFAKLRGKK